MELALVTLASIALACLLGTLLPQTDTVTLAAIQRQFGDDTFMLQALGLFNIFSSNWFLALLVLFTVCLVLGSPKWLRPAYQQFRLRPVLGVPHMHASPNSQAYPLPANPTEAQQAWQAVLTWFKQQGYAIYPAKVGQTAVYCHKFTWARLGPLLAHVALVLMMLAWLGGALTSFTAQLLLNPDTPTPLAAAPFLKPSLPAPYWQGQVPPLTLQLDGFSIEYDENDPKVAKQYTSRLTVTDTATGKVVAKGTTQVNHPMHVAGVTIYQASFAPTGDYYIRVNGQLRRVSASTSVAGRPAIRLPLNPTTQDELLLFPFLKAGDNVPTDQLQVLRRRNGKVIPLRVASKGQPTEQRLTLLAGEPAQSVAEQPLAFVGVAYASGLQLKHAPEVPWLYAAWALLALAVMTSLFVQRQVWLVLEEANSAEGQGKLWVLAKSRKGHANYLKALNAHLSDVLQQSTHC
jgi:cytochrome c biogenesis protein ResB